MNILPIEVHEKITQYLYGKDFLAYAEVFAQIIKQLPETRSRHEKVIRQYCQVCKSCGMRFDSNRVLDFHFNTTHLTKNMFDDFVTPIPHTRPLNPTPEPKNQCHPIDLKIGPDDKIGMENQKIALSRLEN